MSEQIIIKTTKAGGRYLWRLIGMNRLAANMRTFEHQRREIGESGFATVDEWEAVSQQIIQQLADQGALHR